MKKLLIISLLLFFNQLFCSQKITSVSISNATPYDLRIIISDSAKNKGDNRIAKGTTQTFFQKGCVTGLIWYSTQKVKKEINLGFGLPVQNIEARLGGFAEFKDKDMKCGKINWKISLVGENLELS